jgi:hypothetical protein
MASVTIIFFIVITIVTLLWSNIIQDREEPDEDENKEAL